MQKQIFANYEKKEEKENNLYFLIKIYLASSFLYESCQHQKAAGPIRASKTDISKV